MNPVYIFWDQGGLLGQSRCVLSKTNIKTEDDDDNNIFNYYQGYMEEGFIRDLINCFDAFHKVKTQITVR